MFMMAIGWYETQIARMAKGKNPKPNLSGWWTVLDAVWSMGMSSIKPRRA